MRVRPLFRRVPNQTAAPAPLSTWRLLLLPLIAVLVLVGALVSLGAGWLVRFFPAAAFRGIVGRALRRLVPYVQQVSALLLVVAGGYVLWVDLPRVLA